MSSDLLALLDTLDGLHKDAPEQLRAELDVFDPDEREIEAVILDKGVTVLFTEGTGVTLPLGDGPFAPADVDARWAAAKTSRALAYAKALAETHNAYPRLAQALRAALTCSCDPDVGYVCEMHAAERDRLEVETLRAKVAELRTALTPTTDGEREAREWVARFDLDRPMYAGDFALCPSHLRTTLALLAIERAEHAMLRASLTVPERYVGVVTEALTEEVEQLRAKAADAARERETWVCNCGLPMSRNPHPDAGKPAALLDVGAVWVCIPCTVKSRHGATTARFQAERDRDGERAAIVAWLRGPCNDPFHDVRWCSTCESRSDYADAIERGAHNKVTP